MRFAQISDLHITPPGELAYGKVDTAGFLGRAIDRLNALGDSLDAVLITGDLVDGGLPEEYRHLRTCLDRLQAPCYLMVGNHDDRLALREVFADRAYLHEGGAFVQYGVDIGALRIIALDSLIEGEDAGTLCDERLAWLDTELAQSRNRPVVVAIHHPPFSTGVGHMDDILLERDASRRLADIVRAHPNIERVLSGHLHRPIHARFAGTIASTCPSTAHQVMFDLRADAPIAFIMEPPAYALHQWTVDSGLVTHHLYIDSFDGPYPF
ncbi:phosphodiesterase [Pararobbsia alpina]|uniref:3',5'-cyclic adenosine monophosphate phosphodiesterase CpdA n=1 Tax=Pararobbsia alpina TaxID=621374 RepID=A0A6S7CPM8_9BURK|nr:phosphodiesterase [Pararobbsia alpina]CAB3784724.1 3',5'-cyclic adenosine monophosphate phosphodiesterase CpdA [Pararobbsia alpina]